MTESVGDSKDENLLKGEDDEINAGKIDVNAARKILAPFLKIPKKKSGVRKEFILEEFKEYYSQNKPGEVLAKITNSFSDSLKLPTMLNETAELLKAVTSSKGVNLYLTNFEQTELLLCPKFIQKTERNETKYKIEKGTTLAAYVAFTKEFIMSSDILGDERFPDGIPGSDATLKSVICVPVLTKVEGHCIGVIELYRDCFDKPYNTVNLQICAALTGLLGIAAEQNRSKFNLLKQAEIRQYFESSLQLYFCGAVTFDKIVSDLITFSKSMTAAEKGFFFVMDRVIDYGTESDILADVYEERIDKSVGPAVVKKKTRERFAKDRPGIPGYAARYGSTINITDAYVDHRFDPSIDVGEFRTRSVICMPIKSTFGVMAVLQLVNKTMASSFLDEDVEFLMTLSNYAVLACHYNQLKNDHTKLDLQLSVTSTLLRLHIKPSEEEYQHLKSFPVLTENQMPSGFFTFDWYPTVYEDEIPKYVIFIFHSSKIVDEPSFEVSRLTEFVLSVKKAYRPALYHNFKHGFNTLHCMFNILNANKMTFSKLEVVSLFIASLCHDVDHTGLTNRFLTLNNSFLSQLYDDMPLEKHHVQVCFLLLEATGLLSEFSEDEIKRICEEIEFLILSTELSYFFRNQMEMADLLNKNEFSFSEDRHRQLFKGFLMICCDLSEMFKRFDVAKKSTENLYREFFKQGDIEKNLGFEPLPIMDRDKSSAIPENHITFLTMVCYPCVEIIVRIFPNTQQLEILCRNVIDKWKETLSLRGMDVWKPEEAIARNGRERKRGTIAGSTYSSIKSFYSDVKSDKVEFH